jgi:hypothetical protein
MHILRSKASQPRSQYEKKKHNAPQQFSFSSSLLTFTVCPLRLLDGHEKLSPTTHDEYPADEQPDASDDVDVTRKLVLRENLGAHEARPRALVRVD